MRVYQIAKKYKLTTKELIEKLESLGIKDKKSISGLQDTEVKKIEGLLAKKMPAKKEAPLKATKKPGKEADKARGKKIVLTGSETVRELSEKLKTNPSKLLEIFIKQGIFVNINQSPGKTNIIAICEKCGVNPSIEQPQKTAEAEKDREKKENLVKRAPVVTIMGHVDHGKTTILDTLRKSTVADKEFGKITQKIGAYKLHTKNGDIVFIDTPGHEAFTEMRSRGALVTDIVIIVIDAEEGGKPQTFEAIDHAKSAKVPIIVVLNKIDKPNTKIDTIKRELSEVGLMPDEWGGETVYVNTSGISGEGLDTLLEMILLVAEMLELKTVPDGPAEGIIIESNLDRSKGPILTVLVQKGTLKIGDSFVAGKTGGKVRALINDWGKRIEEAGASTPVEILGSNGMAIPGEKFRVVDNEKTARKIAEKEKNSLIENPLAKKFTLQDIYSEIQKGTTKEINIVLKTDFAGSIEAIKDVIGKIPQSEVSISVIHSAAGPINESDILLASASKALVLGFNTNTTSKVEEISKREGVDIRLYKIIYELADELKKAVEGMLEPEEEEILSGQALVKKTYELSDRSVVAGCLVVEGSITRNSLARIVRNGKVVYRGNIHSLKRFKENATEVKQNVECGIGLSNCTDIQTGDVIQSYKKTNVPKKL